MNQHAAYRQWLRRTRRVMVATAADNPDLFRQAKAILPEIKKPSAPTPGNTEGTPATVNDWAGEGKR